MTAPIADHAPPPSLHQPKRALFAAGELVLAALLVFGAVWCWQRGIVRFEYPVDGREPLVSTRYLGNWLGAAIGLTTLAAAFVLDALRQVILAARARPAERDQKDVSQPTVPHV